MKAVPHLQRSPRNIPKPARRSRREPATNAATPCAADGTALRARFASALDALGSPLSRPFAIAVSGGGDSIALMHLVADWLNQRGVPFRRGTVLIVDHSLREGSARDAATAAQWAKSVGFPACVLTSQGTRPRSNVEDAARTARYRLIGDWCRANDIATVVVAHTRDDQAETFLLRLGRGSGVDGLSAMRGRAAYPLPGYDGIELVRPLLDIGRDELRGELRQRAAPWLEDPMNEDPRFARVKLRHALPALEAAGVPVARIARAAHHLGRAREALEAETARFLRQYAKPARGGVLIDGAALRAESREIGLRVLSSVLREVSGRAYRSRFERLEHLYDAVTNGGTGSTLSGCRVGPAPAKFRAFGTATLEVKREGPRQNSAKEADDAAGHSGNAPNKGRIVARLSRS